MRKILQITILFIAAVFTTQSNQAIAEADKNYPATFFNKSLIIKVVEVGDGRVSATMHSEGYEDGTIEQEQAGYEVAYRNFKIRIQSISASSCTFFVEK